MAAHISGTWSSGTYARSCVLSLWLLASAGDLNSVTAQSSPRAADTGPVLLYSPASNLERSEMEMLECAKVSADVAMYSFTDRELAEELGRLARSGVRVRVYRDSVQYEQENQHGLSTTQIPLAAGVQVKVKSSRGLMHLKSYAIDSASCGRDPRTGLQPG